MIRRSNDYEKDLDNAFNSGVDKGRDDAEI